MNLKKIKKWIGENIVAIMLVIVFVLIFIFTQSNSGDDNNLRGISPGEIPP